MLGTTELRISLPTLLLVAVGLSACSSFQQTEYKRPAQPAQTLAVPPSGTDSQPGNGGAAVETLKDPAAAGTYPYGTATQSPEADAGGQGEAYVRGPDGSLWKGKPRDTEAHNADIESCYRYAAAQTENDARIEQDRRAVYGDGFSDTQSVGLLNSKIRRYDNQSRRKSLFSGCMRSKGYATR